jgi:hypothetical protein
MYLFYRQEKPLFLLVLSAVLLAACGGGGGGNAEDRPEPEVWLIPTQFIVDGGPGKDGIPALQNPAFESAATIATVDPDDLVIALRSEGQVKVYPHDIMMYHEIINDGPDDAPFTMSYCPLTGSGVAWQGDVSHADPTFGVSGLLYNSNLLLYDRETGSHWSQMLQKSVRGPRIREVPTGVQLIETTFSTITAMYPDALVMTRNTGWGRSYGDYPYGDYLTERDLLFAVSQQNNSLHPKQLAIGIYSGETAKVYQLSGFGTETQTIHDQFGGQSVVVVGNTALNFAAIYSRELGDGTILSFTPIQGDLPNVMTDTEGNVWDVFGMAVSGPRAGTQLASTQSYTAMWFAWAAFFDQLEIHFSQ